MKPFTWSWSKLKNFRSCPKRHYEIDIAKTYKDDKGEAMIWGNQIHEAFANRIGKGTPLPVTMQRYEKFPALIDRYKSLAEVTVERKLAIAKDFTATGYFDPHTWFRAVADVLILFPKQRTAVTVDWKTGANISPDMEQLGLSAQVILGHYPEIDVVQTSFEWLGHDHSTPVTYRRGGQEMIDLWNQVLPEVNVMEDAHRTLTYPPRPSGLCKNFCPVVSCPYHGKGNR